MDTSFPLLFAAIIGFSHAFEADHLVAVSNIVTKRNSLALAIKDGIFWGLGHTSTILVIGLIMIVGKATFLNGYFGYLEAGVGFMLILLGVFRLYQHFVARQKTDGPGWTGKEHHLAYSIGLVHGLAGSGALILLVMSKIPGNFYSILYLLIFGLGSVAGMLVAAGIFNLPFSKRMNANRSIQLVLILLSSFLCIGYGGYVMMENLG